VCCGYRGGGRPGCAVSAGVGGGQGVPRSAVLPRWYIIRARSSAIRAAAVLSGAQQCLAVMRIECLCFGEY
jgi:hypothetical protein